MALGLGFRVYWFWVVTGNIEALTFRTILASLEAL